MNHSPDTHSKVIGYLLWIFGFMGSHRFYYGRPVTGTISCAVAGSAARRSGVSRAGAERGIVETPAGETSAKYPRVFRQAVDSRANIPSHP